LGVVGGNPLPKNIKILGSNLVTAWKHLGDLRFLYLRPPEVNQVIILLGYYGAIADYHLTP